MEEISQQNSSTLTSWLSVSPTWSSTCIRLDLPRMLSYSVPFGIPYLAWAVMLTPCTVLYCTVLYCTVLYCTVLYCTVLYYTDLVSPSAGGKVVSPVTWDTKTGGVMVYCTVL